MGWSPCGLLRAPRLALEPSSQPGRLEGGCRMWLYPTPPRDSPAFALLRSSLDAASAACQLQLKHAGNRLGKMLE